jgi:hypothetical protein
MLMTEWYPAKYTATGYGVRQANIAVGVTSAVYVIREFSPEIKRAFHRRKAGDGIAGDKCSPNSGGHSVDPSMGAFGSMEKGRKK